MILVHGRVAEDKNSDVLDIKTANVNFYQTITTALLINMT